MPEFMYIVSKMISQGSLIQRGMAKVYHRQEDIVRELGENYKPGSSQVTPFQFPDPTGFGRGIYSNYHYHKDRRNPDIVHVHKVEIAEVYSPPTRGSSSSSSSGVGVRRELRNEDPSDVGNQGGGRRKKRFQTQRRRRV
jgi:hypothetical protein